MRQREGGGRDREREGRRERESGREGEGGERERDRERETEREAKSILLLSNAANYEVGKKESKQRALSSCTHSFSHTHSLLCFERRRRPTWVKNGTEKVASTSLTH